MITSCCYCFFSPLLSKTQPEKKNHASSPTHDYTHFLCATQENIRGCFLLGAHPRWLRINGRSSKKTSLLSKRFCLSATRMIAWLSMSIQFNLRNGSTWLGSFSSGLSLKD